MSHLQARSRLSPKNYRAVPLLSIQSKVMGSIVSKSLAQFLESNDILFKVQISFHWGLGTNDLLTLLHHVWSHVSGFGGSTHVLAVHIASDFDKMSYVGALCKAHGHVCLSCCSKITMKGVWRSVCFSRLVVVVCYFTSAVSTGWAIYRKSKECFCTCSKFRARWSLTTFSWKRVPPFCCQ